MKHEIISALKEILKDFKEEDLDLHLEIPSEFSHGDYATSIAFQLAKILKKSPQQIAQELAASLTPILFAEGIGEVQAIGGFVNFWLSEKELIKNLDLIISSRSGKSSPGRRPHGLLPGGGFLKGKKIMVEFTDPNPFKEFHIGHVYTNIVGESLSRILEANGATVWRADYYGDVGMHVAKAIWGLEKKLLEEKVDFEDLVKKDLKTRIKYFGQAYAYGATAFEEDKQAVEDMKVINKYIFVSAQKMWQDEKNITPQIDYLKGESLEQKKFDRIHNLYTVGRAWSLEYFESLYKRLGMKFDGYYPESIAGEKGYQLVRDHIKDGIFEENEGAIIFSGEKSGLHTRVFINSLGFPTYEAKELGLAPWKYEDFPYDRSIIVTGNEIKEYFKVLVAAMIAIEPELGKKTMHLSHGMVRIPEGKMSSRTGKIVTGESLLDEAVNRAKDLSNNKSDSGKETSEQVGIGAVKYAFLRSSIGKDVEFDFDTSLSLDGNSGPYIQYTYARIQSILAKALSRHSGDELKVRTPESFQAKEDSGRASLARMTEELSSEEILLLRIVYQYAGILVKAAENFSPNTVCEYIFKLAQEFNKFYQKYRILDIDRHSGDDMKATAPEPHEAKQDSGRASLARMTTQDIQTFRLALTLAIGRVLARGLGLLGIDAPKRM